MSVNREKSCPLTFLSKDKMAKTAYRKTYEDMNRVIIKYLEPAPSVDKQKIFAVTSMIIGAVAISRTFDDRDLVIKVLSSSREQVRMILGGI